ncbi:MAG: endonuclease/exonuclease/phosphatase family protein [Phycisphaerales bacterium]|nr:endonuclease/exonuclease/phosphatase family protein [Phycisphaerales bacterium]
MPDINVAWWNLENLFDRAGHPDRDPDLAEEIENELQGWTAAIRNKKLEQLSKVIEMMFDDTGPDLLGVCEVENDTVLQLLLDRVNLPARDYKIAHHMSPDARGIDVSFVFDNNVLNIHDVGHQMILKRRATRDLFWVELEVKETGAVFIAVGNHWPSRSAGRYESAPFRMLAGETLSFILSRLFNEFDVGDKIPVIVMGDFNDEPCDRSMQEYLLGTRDADRVLNARNPILLNLMWPLMADEDPGTLRFRSDWNMLDQFLVNKGMLQGDSLVRIIPESAQIFRPPLVKKSNGEPRRFGRPMRGLDEEGFSDHFAITVTLDAE